MPQTPLTHALNPFSAPAKPGEMENAMQRLVTVLICLLAPALCGWTIVSRDELQKMYDAEKKPTMNASEILEKGIRPYALENARDALAVLAAAEQDFDKTCTSMGFRHSETAFPCNFWMSLKGTVVKIDTESQSGRVWVLPQGSKADPADDEAGTLVLMIGPAIDSMGPRDGFPGLQYEQFNDQTEFGAFGKEINTLLSQYIRERVTYLAKGASVDVVGVMSAWDMPYTNAELVPVIFR